MNKFSKESLAALEGVDHRLIMLANAVLQIHDCTVTEGLRTLEKQKEAYDRGASKTMDSRHLTGHAIDMYPYPIDWKDTKRFYVFGGMVLAVAKMLQVPIRWGGNWDSDDDFTDNEFNDLGHFEIPRGAE